MTYHPGDHVPISVEHAVRDIAPHLFEVDGTPLPDDVSARAVELLVASLIDLGDASPGDNWASIYGARAAHLANIRILDREHGDVHPERAAVDTLKREYDRDPSPVARAIDSFTGDQHTYRTVRSRKGRTTIARGATGPWLIRGTAQVIGRTVAPDPDDIRAAMASHLLTYARRRGNGYNVLDITAIAQTCYGDLLPQCARAMGSDGEPIMTSLLGTDAILSSDAPTIDVHHPACREPIADYNGGPFPVLKTGHEHEHATPDHGVIYADGSWPRSPRLTWSATANNAVEDGTVRRATRRTSIGRVSVRKSERARCAPRLYWSPGPGMVGLTYCPYGTVPGYVRALIGPSDTPGTAWFGHRLMARGATTRDQGRTSTSANGARTRARRVKRSRIPVMDVTTRQGWDVLVSDVSDVSPVKFRTERGWVVSITRSPSHKYNARVTDQDGHVIVAFQARTADTVARRMHAVVI